MIRDEIVKTKPMNFRETLRVLTD